MIVAGFGSRRDVTAQALCQVLRAAEAEAGVAAELLAAPSFRAGSAAFGEMAAANGLTLRFVDEAEMAGVAARCPTRSDRAESAVGHASVAEAVCLAAAGPEARLILPRLAHPTATCALAQTAP